MNTRREYSVVFITTEDWLNSDIERRLLVFRSLMDVYIRNYNVHCLFYTRNDTIATMFNRTGYSLSRDYQCNNYGVPYFNSLLQGAKHFNSRYYAYINSDILIDPEMFSVLSYMQREMKKGSVPIAHEIAGRVTQFDSSHMPFVFSNLSEIAFFYNTYNMNYSALRHVHSAVLVNMLYYS